MFQKRFLFSGKSDTKWYVPISFTVSNKTEKFETVTPDGWLTPDKDLEFTDVLTSNDWIILNNQESGKFFFNQ